MKVTRIETLRASRWILVKVHTDQGIVGIGDCHPASGSGGNPYAVLGALRFCEEQLAGKDPLAIEAHWQNIYRRHLFRGGPDAMAALGAVDMALWDIAGKAYGLPVYKLLGGPTRDRVRLYAHVVGSSPKEMAENARKAVAQGFTCVRFYPLDASLPRQQYRSVVRTAVSYVDAVRQAVGDDVDICIDVVCRLKPNEAIAVGRALEPYGLYFFEDPIEPENIDAISYVASQMPVPVATGERLCTIFDFRELLNKNGAQFVRPDLSLAGGITNCKKIAALAEASYVGVVPHNPLSPVLTAACVQLAAAIHNCPILEYTNLEHQPPRRDIVREPLTLEDGYLVVPVAPGLGIQLDEEALRRHPEEPWPRPPLIRPDGSLLDY